MSEKQSAVELGTVYDINKALIDKEPVLSKHILDAKLKKTQEYFKYRINQYEKNNPCAKYPMYFMLLCHEQRDYTVFILDPRQAYDRDIIRQTKNTMNELKICLQNRGKIVSIEPTEDEIGFEIWIRVDKNNYCYYLFPCDQAIIHCDY